jgi:hypothetical protein
MQTNLDPREVSETPPDRRLHPRYRFSVPITIRSSNGASIPGISIEISETGISAITADSLEVNEMVELEPIAAGKVLALVRRNVGRVYGFEFLNLAPDQTQQIRASCKLLSRYQCRTLGI